MAKGAFGLPSVFLALLWPAIALADGLVNPSLAPQAETALRLSEQSVYLSPEAVTIRAKLANNGIKPLSERLTLALPVRDLAAERAKPKHLPDPRDDEFLGVSLSVDGQPKPAERDTVARLDGADITGQLRRHGLPVTAVAPVLDRAVDAIAPERREFLERRGWLKRDGDALQPQWTVQTSLSWPVAVAPYGSTTVELRYRPSRGAERCTVGGDCAKFLQPAADGACRPQLTPDQLAQLEKRARAAEVGHLVAEDVALALPAWPAGKVSYQLDRLGAANPMTFCAPDLAETFTSPPAEAPGLLRFGIVRLEPKLR